MLGGQEGFFAQLVDVVVENFGTFFAELIAARDIIHEVRSAAGTAGYADDPCLGDERQQVVRGIASMCCRQCCATAVRLGERLGSTCHRDCNAPALQR